ncbi:MAG: retroviral-like aspartic protease [Deltaproteobacteria bacterium]|nr:retroviral-like aspartic protease [Deltaproteobacteria bacterium]
MIRIRSSNVFQTSLGEIWHPFLVVEIANLQGEFIPYEILLDSGADISLITFMTGEYLGLTENPGEQRIRLRGIKREPIEILLRQVTMRIDGQQFTCRVGWAMDEQVPLVLGRLDVFRRFHIEFRQEEQEIILQTARKKE